MALGLPFAMCSLHVAAMVSCYACLLKQTSSLLFNQAPPLQMSLTATMAWSMKAIPVIFADSDVIM